MSDVAVSDLKGGHAPAQKVFSLGEFLNFLITGWWNEGCDEAESEREREASRKTQGGGRGGDKLLL